MEHNNSFGNSRETWETNEFYAQLQAADEANPAKAKEMRAKALGGEIILVVSKNIPTLSLVEEGVA